MHLYFTDSLIPDKLDESIIEDLGGFNSVGALRNGINDFFKRKNIKSPYSRTAYDENKNQVYIDYGSWSRFLFIQFSSQEELNEYVFGKKKEEPDV